MPQADDRPDQSSEHRPFVVQNGREHPARRLDPAPHQDDVHQRQGRLEVELLRRYSNREDILKPLVSVLDRINAEPEPDKPQDQLPSADGPTPATWRVSERLSTADVKTLVKSYLAGNTIRVLAERYGISTTSVKRLLREHGARKLPPRSAA